jgi:hypothetical protein
VAQHEGVPEEQLPPPVNEADATLGMLRGFRRASTVSVLQVDQVWPTVRALRAHMEQAGD